MVVRGAACCRRSQLGRNIDGEPVEPLRGVTQIVGTDDVVPFEDPSTTSAARPCGTSCARAYPSVSRCR